MPPAAKPAAQRQRRNRTTTNALLEAPAAAKVALPATREWLKPTLAWWETIWDSPMTAEWVDADVPGLLLLAVLHDKFWETLDPKVHAELRMASREFGLSPLSRRSLQWEVHRVESVTKKPDVATPVRRGRARLSILSGKSA